MELPEDHRKMLKRMGLQEKDFDLFDGKFVSYEYDGEKGIRLYDPYYRTSYNEYIDVDGWSSWSSEEDTFMSDILKPAQEEARQRENLSAGQNQEEIAQSLEKKFSKKKTSDPQ